MIQELKDTFDPAILFLDRALEDGILGFEILQLPHELLFDGLDLHLVNTLFGDVTAYAARAGSRLLTVTLSHQLFTILVDRKADG